MKFHMSNKLTLFTGLCLMVTVGLILPSVQPAQAGLTDILTSWITKVITGIIDVFTYPIAMVLMIIQAVTGILPVISGEIYKVTIALNDTIALTPASANAGPNDMVVVGWQFTRDLANMFFVVILAWVGFATILRLQSYEVKKIIPKLVLIALLINFIPVITGVILDIASIFTNYFAQRSLNIGALLWEKLPATEIARGGTDGLLQLIPGNGGISGIAVKSLMGIFFNIIAFLVLGLYALIFIVRIVAIWVLVVLAPLAWLGYIIPAGEKLWSMWWKQFIQWAIIGISLTFFLYLSGFVLGGSIDCNVDEVAINQQYGFATGILSGIIGENLICNILPFVAGIAIMLIGFFLSITIAPSGANTILKSAQKGGLAAGKAFAPQVWRGVKETAKAPGKAIQHYQTARTMGLSRGQAFGAAVLRPQRLWSQWRPALPTGPIQTYQTGRAVGLSRTAALGAALRRWRDWSPAGVKTRNVTNGFKNAIKVGWATGVGGKAKKTGTRTCPTCHSPGIANSAASCPRCGHVF
jgi:hypothetical protein